MSIKAHILKEKPTNREPEKVAPLYIRVHFSHEPFTYMSVEGICV